MDNLFAIGIGLALRTVIDVVTDHNHRLNGSLVGLWEGAVLHHFLGKFPRSYDPYVAFGFRLFVDMIITENLTRLAITLLWTGLGMLFADLTVDMQTDRRFRQLWRASGYSWPFYTSRSTKSRSTPSRVQFYEIPSTTVSSVARTSSLRTPTSSRRTSGSTPTVSFARPSRTPVPGAFSENSEAESDASRQQILDEHQRRLQEYRERLQEQQRQLELRRQEERRRQEELQREQPQNPNSRSPTDIEYIPRELDMPTIPDTPGEEIPPVRRTPTILSSSSSSNGYTQPWARSGPTSAVSNALPIRPRPSTSYVSSFREPFTSTAPVAPARASSSAGSANSRLTTPQGSARGVLSPVSQASGRSGLTTPPTARTELPPVNVIDEARSQPRATPTAHMSEVSEPAPIPIRLRLVSDTTPTPSNLPEIPEPAAASVPPPPISEVPEIPTVEDAEVAAGQTATDPPPSYTQLEAQEIPDDKSDITAAESVISGHSRSAIVARADTLRKQAEEEEAARKKLEKEYRDARSGESTGRL